MSIGDIIKSIIELAAVIFVVWGLFHEDRFVVFESKIAAYLRRRRFKVVKGGVKATCLKSDYRARRSV